MEDRKFDFFEDDQLKELKNSINYVKEKAEKTLDNKANGEVFNEALNNRMAGSLDNTTNNQTMVNDVQSNEKVLVREKSNAPKVINPSSNVQEPTTNNSIYSQYENVPSSENPFESLKENGNANANVILIVIASFVIVAMILIICVMILGDLGILPLE